MLTEDRGIDEKKTLLLLTIAMSTTVIRRPTGTCAERTLNWKILRPVALVWLKIQLYFARMAATLSYVTELFQHTVVSVQKVSLHIPLRTLLPIFFFCGNDRPDGSSGGAGFIAMDWINIISYSSVKRIYDLLDHLLGVFA